MISEMEGSRCIKLYLTLEFMCMYLVTLQECVERRSAGAHLQPQCRPGAPGAVFRSHGPTEAREGRWALRAPRWFVRAPCGSAAQHTHTHTTRDSTENINYQPDTQARWTRAAQSHVGNTNFKAIPVKRRVESFAASLQLRSWVYLQDAINELMSSPGFDSTFHNGFHCTSTSMLNSWMDDTTSVRIEGVQWREMVAGGQPMISD